MKFTPGIAVGAMSGSIGGSTASHNRFGPYFRTRAKPVVSTTPDAMEAKAILSAQTTRWQTLTDENRAAWKSYAETHPTTDKLGQQITLTPHMTFVGINARIDKDGGTLLDDPPAEAVPDGLQSLVLAADIGLGNVDVTYTASPLAANDKLWVQAVVQNSAGKLYIANLLRVILISPAAQASPLDIEAELAAKFGTLQVGQRVTVVCSVYDSVTGLLSTGLRSDTTIITT